MSMLPRDDCELFYKEAGSGPPILLIHGTTVDADSWGETFDLLAAGHRVVAYDRRGHSRSRDAGAAATGDWDLHTSDAEAFLDRLDLAPATVVGWSGGANVALKLAMDRADDVSSLVLVEPVFDAPHHVTPRFAWQFLRARALYALGRDRSALEGFMRFACTRRGDVNTWVDPEFPEERREVNRANSGAYKAEGAARRTLPTVEEMRSIRQPVTVLLGGQSDAWFARMANAVPKTIPQARVVTIPHGNHAFGFTAPRELADAIREAAARPAVLS